MRNGRLQQNNYASSSKHAKDRYEHLCCNHSLGLVTKTKGLQGCGPRESLGVTSHTPESVRKCEGMNPHTPKATPTLRDGVLMDS